MGCGGGKQSKKVDMSMKETGIAEIDEMFGTSAAPLKTLEEVANSLEKTKRKLKRATYMIVVK